MKKLLYLLLILGGATAFQKASGIRLDKEEARKAYEYLLAIRKNPQEYYKKLQFSKNTPVSKVVLKWNDTLSKVAEERALDMAKRNYFSHVNPDKVAVNYLLHQAGYSLPASWYKNKRDNYFESISAGTYSGIEGIDNLIIDISDREKGHRKHLMGIGEFNSNLVDIGIGFAWSDKSNYQSYMCVIIAKHTW